MIYTVVYIQSGEPDSDAEKIVAVTPGDVVEQFSGESSPAEVKATLINETDLGGVHNALVAIKANYIEDIKVRFPIITSQDEDEEDD